MSRLAKFAALALSLAPVALTNPALAEEVDQNRLPPSQDPTRVANGLAQTPPMGWNSEGISGASILKILTTPATFWASVSSKLTTLPP